MNKTTFLKALALSAFFIVGLATTAQRTDGFFNTNNDEIYADRDEGAIIGTIDNQQFGQDVPLGSGFLIMVAAGAGYAVSRRRRSMRKTSMMLLALAIVFIFTQCKKKVETIAPINNGGVQITVTVNNGAKHSVITNPENPSDLGKVYFSLGDKLMVGNGGKHVGTLEYNGTNFTGTIGADVELTDTDQLHFYYTGGREPVSDFEYGEDHYYVYEITNQSDNLPVFSYGCTVGNYDPNEHNYYCTLLNKCALVKFTLPEGSRGDVMVSGMHAVVLFSFNNSLDNIFEPQENLGSITLNRRGDNEGWAILFPQDAVDDATVMVDGNWYTNAVDVPAIHNNDLIVNPVISVSASQLYTPKFSVSADKAIHFAPGNLQYKASTDTWRFAENQWDYVGGEGGKDEKSHYGTVHDSSNNNASSSYDGWIDLYMWGTSGWKDYRDNDCLHYEPWSQRDSYDHGVLNVHGVGPSLGSPVGSDLNGTHYDWGVHNAIYNPLTETTDVAGTWRTATYEEMNYLLNNRPHASSLRGYGIIHDVNGLIILPDNCPIPTGLVFSPDRTDENEYNDDEWSLMEDCGAMFFPCAGFYRDLDDPIGKNNNGHYWTATHYGQSSGSSKEEFGPSAKAYSFDFSMNDYPCMDENHRYQHYSVRLVKDVTNSK